MLVEFEARIARHKREAEQVQKEGRHDSPDYWRAVGALEEAEHLKAFYESQMVAKDRIKPEK